MPKTETEPESKSSESVFLPRARMEPRWAAYQIDALRRVVVLIIQQVDMTENDDRTIKRFRGGTLMEQARTIVAELDAAVVRKKS